jgi:hypothetical protein
VLCGYRIELGAIDLGAELGATSAPAPQATAPSKGSKNDIKIF